MNLMPLWRTHTPPQIYLDGLAVPTHSTAASSPLGAQNVEASTFPVEVALKTISRK
jgi:hypothetical protein